MPLLVACGRLLGLSWLALGIFLEKPLFFALSVVCLALVLPPHEVVRRLRVLAVEWLVLLALLAIQLAAGGALNALVIVMYLLGLLSGMLLPDPRNIGPRYWLPLLLLCIGLTDAYQSGVLEAWGLLPSESAFGGNPDEYEFDPRALSYAVLMVLLYLSPHFSGFPAAMHAVVMLLAAAAGSNKFGMAFALLKNLPRALVVPLLLLTFTVQGYIGFSAVEVTAARAALWSDFSDFYPGCETSLGVCTQLILLNNQEGVRSFHSLLLDFGWYGGPAGFVAAALFMWRAATAASLFGRSAGVLFALSLLFGFPPFFNERHVLVVYAFLVLFQKGRAVDLADRSLRTDGTTSGRRRRIALVPQR